MGFLNNLTLNNTGNTNYSTDIFCLTPQAFTTFEDFSLCYQYFFMNAPTRAILEILLCLGTVVTNTTVIICLLLKPKLSLFDQILIGHGKLKKQKQNNHIGWIILITIIYSNKGIVDGLTGVVDIPFYHINDIMGYWPFGSVLGSMWSIYDNNINITTSLHMLYMSYVRLRSIRSPKAYSNEILCKKPWLVMICFWATGIHRRKIYLSI